MEIYLRPRDILYSQDSIGSRFSNEGKSLSDTFRDVVEERIELDDLLKDMTVVWHRGYYWTISGNRRLFVLRQLEQHGYVGTVKVICSASDVFRRQVTKYCNFLSKQLPRPTLKPSGRALESRLGGPGFESPSGHFSDCVIPGSGEFTQSCSRPTPFKNPVRRKYVDLEVIFMSIFLDNGPTDFDKVHTCEKDDSSASFSLDIFCLLIHKIGPQ